MIDKCWISPTTALTSISPKYNVSQSQYSFNKHLSIQNHLNCYPAKIGFWLLEPFSCFDREHINRLNTAKHFKMAPSLSNSNTSRQVIVVEVVFIKRSIVKVQISVSLWNFHVLYLIFSFSACLNFSLLLSWCWTWKIISL